MSFSTEAVSVAYGDAESGALRVRKYKRHFRDGTLALRRLGLGRRLRFPHLEWKGESIASREIFTDVFIRRDGKWLCVSSHSCDLPDAEAK